MHLFMNLLYRPFCLLVVSFCPRVLQAPIEATFVWLDCSALVEKALPLCLPPPQARGLGCTGQSVEIEVIAFLKRIPLDD